MQTTSHPDAVIVPAAAADLAEIAELARVIWRQHYPGIITRAQIDYMLNQSLDAGVMARQIEQESITYLRLLVGGEAVGFASYGPSGPAETKLHKLYVRDDWRGRGLGKRLLEHVVREAANFGGRMIVLNVNKYNRDSIAFYEFNGFTVRESVSIDIGGGFVMDDYVMARPLAFESAHH